MAIGPKANLPNCAVAGHVRANPQREWGTLKMQTTIDEWADSSGMERIAHCLARSLLAEKRAEDAEGDLKRAYLDIAAHWLTLANVVQSKATARQAQLCS